jgi:hypothetical protein
MIYRNISLKSGISEFDTELRAIKLNNNKSPFFIRKLIGEEIRVILLAFRSSHMLSDT